MSIRRHTLYNVSGAVFALAISLATVPIYIRVIGEARYGVLAIAFLLLGYFGLFDLGLGRAAAQRIARMGNASAHETTNVFWTAIYLNLFLGAAGAAVLWMLGGYLFGHLIPIDAPLGPEIHAAMPWLALAVPLTMVSGTLTGALEGRAAFVDLNLVAVLNSALVQLLPLGCALLYGADLALLLAAVVVARGISVLVLFLRCRRHVFQGVSFRISRLDARALLAFGGWVTVSSVVGPMMVILDRFLIGAGMGLRHVTFYTVPFQLAERATLLPAALASAVFPRLAAAPADEARHLALTTLRHLVVVLTLPLMLGILVIEPFLGWWLGVEFAHKAGLTAQLLLLGFWANALARIPYVHLQAAGRPDLVAKCHVAELVPYLLALWLCMRLWGLPGAAVAFGLRTLVDLGLLLWLSRNLSRGLELVYLPLALLVATAILAANVSVGDWLWLLGVAMLVAGMLGWSWARAGNEIRGVALAAVHRTKGLQG